MKCGIYKIINLINGKVYIGQTINYTKRKSRHFLLLKKGIHHNEYLQRAYNKYGKENFKIEFICTCEEKDLDKLECEYIKKYNSMVNENGYNLMHGGQKYRKFSDEVKQKMSRIRKGKKFTESHKLNISLAHKGKKMPKESIIKGIKTRTENKTFFGEGNPNAIISNKIAGDILDELYKGEKVTNICEQYNVSQDVVYGLMHNKTYIDIKPEIREIIKNRTKSNQNNKNIKAVELYLKGMSQNAIAKELKISRNTLRRLLLERNIDTKVHKNQYANTVVNK